MPPLPANPILVRDADAADASAIAALYNHYVTETIVTFEETPVSPAEIVQRMDAVRSSSLPWLVAVHGSQVVGYAYASSWRPRRAYRFSAEVTVYVSPDLARQGVGFLLYARLLPLLRSSGVHAAMGGIALPNEASVRLHEKFGFRKVAHLAEVGFKFERWIDVGYWQILL